MRIGVDLGGTKIEAIALDATGASSCAAACRRRATTTRPRSAAIAAWSTDVEARAWAHAAAVGVGMPGTLSPATGLVKNANSTWLNGRPLADDLERRARAAGALRERRQLLRAVRGHRRRGARARAVVFGVILGTGTGGGIVVDGRVLAAAQRDRRRVGPQPAALAARRRAAGPAVLLRPHGLHRDVPLGPGPRARPRARDRRSARPRRRSPSGGRRATRRAAASARALRRPPGARPRHGHQRARPRRDRARRRDVAARAALRERAARSGRATSSPTASTRARAARHGDSSGVRGAAWLWSPEEA